MYRVKFGPLLAVLSLAAIVWSAVPPKGMFSIGAMGYERSTLVPITAKSAEQRAKVLLAEIRASQQSRTYAPQPAFAKETELQFLQFNYTPSYEVMDNVLEEEQDGTDPAYWVIQTALTTSKQLREDLFTADQKREFESLISSPVWSKIWNPHFIDILTRPQADFIFSRMYAFGLWCLALLLWALWRAGFSVRRIFGPATPKIISYATALFLCSFQGVAVAQQTVSKLKKDQQALSLVVNGSADSAGDDPKPPQPPQNVGSIEAFGDFKHDRQGLFTLHHKLTSKFDFSFFTKTREAANDASLFTAVTAGFRYRPTKNFALTVLSGPQFEYVQKNANQETSYAVLSYNIQNLSLLSLNSFSRGLEHGVAASHRHAVIARAGPMPKWLAAQVEVKSSRGIIRENFWGPRFNVGQFFKGWWQNFSGLYIYPYRDFKAKYDLRIGLTRSFSF